MLNVPLLYLFSFYLVEQSLRETVSNLQASIDLHEFQVNMLRTQLAEQQSRVKSVETQLSFKDTIIIRK